MNPAAYVALFGAGVASFLAPCVVPLVPAYLGMITGSATAQKPGKMVSSTLVFIAGFATVFALFGMLAGLAGSKLDALQTWVQRIGGLLVLGFGLALLGVVRGPAMREFRAIKELPSAASAARPLVLGLAFGAAWTPCVGPLLGAALVVAAKSASAVTGATLLIAYAAGIGVPFLAASLLIASWPSIGVRLRKLSKPIERVAGVLLCLLGVLLLSGQYAHFTSGLARFFPTIQAG
jgi:cytochrome c-type biogenesis protein